VGRGSRLGCWRRSPTQERRCTSALGCAVLWMGGGLRWRHLHRGTFTGHVHAVDVLWWLCCVGCQTFGCARLGSPPMRAGHLPTRPLANLCTARMAVWHDTSTWMQLD
jgi:hypothetical protein